MTINAAINTLDALETKKLFAELYGSGTSIFMEQKKRYSDLIGQFRKRFGDREIYVFSSPGRSEIGGNHTDHNHGKVLTASIQLDCIGVISPNDNNTIHICDRTYNEDYSIDIAAPPPCGYEKGSSALICGMLEGFKKEEYTTGGFYGCFSSQVIPASGVSSSAAFEMLICHIINQLYNEGNIPIEKMARIGQYAENVYWKKASGLLDQMACAFGGFIAIDFENPAAPVVERIPFDFAAQDCSLLLVNTGGNHAELSREYSAIPEEMKQVAYFFGKYALRDVSIEDVVKNLSVLRAQCGDRAVMRAFHFIEENIRVDQELAALKANDFSAFLRHITASGNSSWKWLQNVYVPSDCVQNQSVSVTLALTEIFISRHNLPNKAACRIHGGGFAGVIQVFLPNAMVKPYTQWVQQALQSVVNPVFSMSIRPYGVQNIMPLR
ncbi:MAG: galactokinase [Treponema sp.]|jgi:galactokinase|nr:galactokinase [Treponema sp.]